MLRHLFTFVLSAAALTAHAEDYCLAIRGNGELAPAHWGAVSNVVERLGLPQAQAGGSSASITMFLLDAIATNEFVQAGQGSERALRAALLVKSLEGFTDFVRTTGGFRDFKVLYGEWKRLADTSSLQEILQILTVALKHRSSPDQVWGLITSNQAAFSRAMATAKKTGLLNYQTMEEAQARISRLMNSTTSAEALVNAEKARFYLSEVLASIKVVGSFDAATDSNLFFRPGVIDFDVLAQQLGRIARFYSALEARPHERAQWTEFFKTCTMASARRTWEELTRFTDCGSQFNRLANTYFMDELPGFDAELVGRTIPSFPTTAVLTGSAVQEVEKGFQDYRRMLSPLFGMSFRLSDPNQVRFGYWGLEDGLQTIRERLSKSDEKSKRFLSLGRAPWSEVLRLSPAEPGLSPLKFFTHGRDNYVSAGGWSDLAPVLVLKASGCKRVVYVTRKGGESLFAQGVAKRLIGLERPWDVLKTSTPEESKANWILNNQGDDDDMHSLWSKLFNVANPGSSLKRSINEADAVLCTNWNSFAIKDGIRGMIDDAYHAPYYVPTSNGLRDAHKLQPRLQIEQMNPDGYPEYVGCY